MSATNEGRNEREKGIRLDNCALRQGIEGKKESWEYPEGGK